METTFVHIVVLDQQEGNSEILAVFERLKDAQKFRDEEEEEDKQQIYIHSLPLEK